MTDFDNTNTGALFKNDKGDNPNRPDYRGNLDVGGTEYWISAWLKTSKKGQKFMSLSVSAKDENKAPNPANNDDFNDEIPFAVVLPTLLGIGVAVSEIATTPGII